jgi:hypothetical protein
MKYAFLLLFSLFGVFHGVAQTSIEWQTCLGGSGGEEGHSIQQTTDGGYILAGLSTSNDGDVSGGHGASDCWVVKLDSAGQIEWQKPLGGTKSDAAYFVQQTTDGGYFFAGSSYSNDGDLSENKGISDFWAVKLSVSGDIEWQQSFGGSDEDILYSALETSSGEYIVIGQTYSSDGDISQNLGGGDIWLLKLNSTGQLQWEKSYGGSKSDVPFVIKETTGDGYVIAGKTSSNDGDVSGNNGNTDSWVFKIDALGNIEWQNALGGIGIDFFDDIVQTDDGGYVAIGGTASGNTGDVTGHHGAFDVWVVKLYNSGELEWQKTIGGSKSDLGRVIVQTSDNGLVIGAETSSTDGDASDHSSESQDWWILKLNASGDIQWNKILGGGKIEICGSLQQTADSGFIIAGQTYSNDGDVSGLQGTTDIWVVKLSPETTSSTLSPFAHKPLELYPNPASQSITVQIPGELDETRLSVRITDLLGREMLQRACNNGESLDLAQLPNGIFLLSATSASGKVFFGKFRKQE